MQLSQSIKKLIHALGQKKTRDELKLFVAEGETRTFGEMDPDEKHAISHRADAFRKLVEAVLG